MVISSALALRIQMDDAKSAKEFGAAVSTSGEQMWRMPLLEELKDQLKSDVADMKNAGDRYGGSISAALFLREFVGDAPWIHVDIAGPSMASSASLARPHPTARPGADGRSALRRIDPIAMICS